MSIVKLQLVAHYRDHGDGSSSIDLYNSVEELGEHIAKAGWSASLEDVLSNDDTYENGSVSYPTIEIDTETNQLAGRAHISCLD